MKAILRWHRPLMVVSGFMVVLMVVSSVGLIVDDRHLLGAPIWLKPLKFAISFAIYSTTLAWMLSIPHRGRRWTWWLATVFALAGGFMDVSIVFIQAARGTFSHFNGSDDAFDDRISAMFGIGVQLIMLTSLGIAAILAFERLADRTVGRSVHTGLLLSLAGMGVGVLMIFATKGQIALDATGREVPLMAGHSIGVPDGSPGMPLTGWSTTGGDLRAPHFLGLHGLQAMLLVGIGTRALARRFSALRDESVRVALVTVAALGFGALVVLATIQALRGQPVIHPDAITLCALGAIVLATVVSVWAVVAAGKLRSSRAMPDPVGFPSIKKVG